jgi:recombinational DNA repair ATPase RecF
MLKKISIENYRSCLSTSFECDPHLSVLIGPNGSGKTNILQAIMLLHKMAQEEERSRIEKSRITVSSRIRATFAG